MSRPPRGAMGQISGVGARALAGKLSEPPVVPDDLSPPVASRKALQDMGWRPVRRVLWKVFCWVE